MASPEPAVAEKFIEDLGDGAVDVLENDKLSMGEREAKLGALLAKGFDMPFLARLALGRDFRNLSPAQQSDYEELFNQYVLTTYSRRFTEFKGIQLKIEGAETISDDDLVVTTEIKSENGPPAKVDWRIRERNDEPKVIDVVIEGVSMVISQRQEFQSIVQSKGLDGLMAVLRARSERGTATTGGGN